MSDQCFTVGSQFSGTSLKVDDNPADILTMMLWSSAGNKHWQDFHPPFKLVPENCASYMLQPAEKPPLCLYTSFLSTGLIAVNVVRNCSLQSCILHECFLCAVLICLLQILIAGKSINFLRLRCQDRTPIGEVTARNWASGDGGVGWGRAGQHK